MRYLLRVEDFTRLTIETNLTGSISAVALPPYETGS